tara:strand:- start:2171 stop:2659 length:489 start_codon:yes stop_codon:yes gene_type:complete
MPAAYLDENGDWVKQCSTCKEVQPVAQYYNHTPDYSNDGYKPRCRECTKAKHREENARRAKKRRQQSNKLDKIHVDWIREQKGKLSTRATAKAFSKRFFNMKISNSTVSRIFNNIIHTVPDGEDTMSIYDLLEGASDFSGSVEEYIESKDEKKIKFYRDGRG